MQPMTITRESTAGDRLRSLRRANFRMIEAELYNYRWSRKMLVQVLRELNLVADSTVMAPPLDEDRVQTSRYFADIVAQRAEELANERAYTVAVLQETARRLEAIEYMLKQLDEPRRRFVELKWFNEKRVDDKEIEKALGISSRTLRRWKRDAIEIVASRLGLLV